MAAALPFIRLPTTPEGRQLLRDTLASDGLRPTYPDGSRLGAIDWDILAQQIEQSAAAYEAFCQELTR
jgi:hypothetical protein